MPLKLDLFFIKLSLINSFLLTLLVIVVKKTSHAPLTGNLFLDFFPSMILLLGVWAFTKSKEVPYPLLLVARASMVVAFFGIIYISSGFYKEWRSGIYDKVPKNKTSLIINPDIKTELTQNVQFIVKKWNWI